MQTVVCKVLHALNRYGLDTHEVVRLLVVRQSEAQRIDRLHATAAHADLDLVSGLETPAIGRKYNLSRDMLLVRRLHTAFELRRRNRYVVGVNQIITVDIAAAYVTLEVRITQTQTRIVHIRRKVVAVHLAVVVHVALNIALRSRNTEHIYLTARAVITYGLRYTDTDITCRRMSVKCEGFGFGIALPREAAGLGPRVAVHTVCYASLQNGTVARIHTRQVIEAVERVDRMQVDRQLEGHGLGIVERMPYVARLYEIEEPVYTRTALRRSRRSSGNARDGELQRVGLRAKRLLAPIRDTVGIHGAHAERIVGLGLKVGKEQLGRAHRRIKHAVKLDLVIVGIVDGRPYGRYGISLDIIVGSRKGRRLECSVPRKHAILRREHETVNHNPLLG